MSKQANPDANADFVAALNALENVSANKTNPAFKGSKYVSLDQLLDAVKPVLAKHNLALTQWVDTTADGRIGVQTAFRHRDGTEYFRGCDSGQPRLFLLFGSPADESARQNLGPRNE